MVLQRQRLWVVNIEIFVNEKKTRNHSYMIQSNPIHGLIQSMSNSGHNQIFVISIFKYAIFYCARVQISGCDDVGCRSKTGALYHTDFDASDGWQMTGISRAMVYIYYGCIVASLLRSRVPDSVKRFWKVKGENVYEYVLCMYHFRTALLASLPFRRTPTATNGADSHDHWHTPRRKETKLIHS